MSSARIPASVMGWHWRRYVVFMHRSKTGRDTLAKCSSVSHNVGVRESGARNLTFFLFELPTSLEKPARALDSDLRSHGLSSFVRYPGGHTTGRAPRYARLARLVCPTCCCSRPHCGNCPSNRRLGLAMAV